MKSLIKKLIPESVYYFVWKSFYQVLSFLFSFYPIKKNKIFVTNYYGADYGDNGKYIVEELLKQNTEYDIVWQLKGHLLEKNHLPKGVRAVKYYSPAAVFESQTAGVWIDNSRKVFGRKRKGQLYIQTWHGGPGIKRCERDVENELGKRYVKHAIRDSKMCDIILSNSDFMTNLYEKAFWYDGEILRSGSPRNDVICKNPPEIKQKVCDFFGIDSDKKLLLYAPTFRKDGSLDVYDIDLPRCCDALSRRFGGEWKALLRLHPNISDKAEEMSQSDAVIPATAYPDMQELLAAADCLITDYSSSSVDYTLSKKPCILYASDIEKYRNDRGYYFRFEDFPFPIASNNYELEEAVLNFNDEKYQQDLKTFKEFTGHEETGVASRTVADLIEKHIREVI